MIPPPGGNVARSFLCGLASNPRRVIRTGPGNVVSARAHVQRDVGGSLRSPSIPNPSLFSGTGGQHRGARRTFRVRYLISFVPIATTEHAPP